MSGRAMPSGHYLYAPWRPHISIAQLCFTQAQCAQPSPPWRHTMQIRGNAPVHSAAFVHFCASSAQAPTLTSALDATIAANRIELLMVMMSLPSMVLEKGEAECRGGRDTSDALMLRNQRLCVNSPQPVSKCTMLGPDGAKCAAAATPRG